MPYFKRCSAEAHTGIEQLQHALFWLPFEVPKCSSTLGSTPRETSRTHRYRTTSTCPSQAAVVCALVPTLAQSRTPPDSTRRFLVDESTVLTHAHRSFLRMGMETSRFRHCCSLFALVMVVVFSVVDDHGARESDAYALRTWDE